MILEAFDCYEIRDPPSRAFEASRYGHGLGFVVGSANGDSLQRLGTDNLMSIEILQLLWIGRYIQKYRELSEASSILYSAYH